MKRLPRIYHALALGVSAAAFAGCGQISASTPNGAAESLPQIAPQHVARANSSKTTFNFTGTQQNFVVPMGITHVTIQASGAGGGIGGATHTGAGGFAQATIPVTPGESLAVFVGGTSTGSYGQYGGFNGGGNGGPGGGGGASDVRQSGTALANRVIVAGGGGGGSDREFSCHEMKVGVPGGRGGDRIGARGGGGPGPSKRGGPFGGWGGTQRSGGKGGGRQQKGDTKGAAGTAGIGGNGALGGGGGGGGYYGGGGGGGVFVTECGGYDLYESGGGGGGSSYVEKNAKHVTMTRGGGSPGDGVIVISWQ